jgi:hypothetical protein
VAQSIGRSGGFHDEPIVDHSAERSEAPRRYQSMS